MKNISWHIWPQFEAQSLQIPQKYQVIHAMDFASVKLFSVTYVGLYLARKYETQQTWKQTVKQLPDGRDSLITPS